MPGIHEPVELAMALADMARDLLAQETVQETLDRIVNHSVNLVDGCEAAGIMVVRDKEVRTLSVSDDLVTTSDRLQGELGEGPCYDAARREQQVYRVSDMSERAVRWPLYSPKARELGIGSMMGFLLFTDDDNLGALDLYSSQPGAFTEASERVGWLLASHAAVAFANARNDAQLREAIGTRQDIGEALGIVMERYKVPEEQAFAVLRKASQDQNLKLRELARSIVETGEIPGAR
jgi:transcriptional regulator with GAF, ATPase, and Fis domain